MEMGEAKAGSLVFRFAFPNRLHVRISHQEDH
jgi:hypothetical protein